MQPTLPRHPALRIRSLIYAYLPACLHITPTILIINSTLHYIGDVMLVVHPHGNGLAMGAGPGGVRACCVCLGCVESEGCVDRAGITTSLGRVLPCGATWALGYGIPVAGKW